MNTATSTFPVAGDKPVLAHLLSRTLATAPTFNPLVLRLALAVVMFPHGAQKALGWYGGSGFGGTMDFLTATMGIPAVLAFGVIALEFLGPVLLLAGLGTRPVALGLGVVMAGAMFMVHVPHGFFMNWFGSQAGEGIEYFLLAIGIALALLVSGGGRLSLDSFLHRRVHAS